MVNFDYASHTPVDERVLLEFCRVEREFFGNGHAAHLAGRAADGEMRRVTAGIAGLLEVKPGEIIYTSGASEANNLAIKGLTRAYKHVGRHVLSTCLEHPSVSGTLAALQDDGYEIELVKISADGKIDLCALKSALRDDTVLLCVSAVDSEIGVVQPIADIADVLSAYPNCHLHVDAAQAMGKIPVHISGASTLCFSPHKFHGLCGSGVLFKREGVVLEPLIHGGVGRGGGESAGIYRGGTPALALAASTYKALELALDTIGENFEKVAGLRRRMLDSLMEYPMVRINSPPESSPYILNLSVTGVNAAEFQSKLDANGVLVSVKSACSTDNAPSRPVFAITKDKKNAMSSWRVSFSHLTTVDDVDEFLRAFDKGVN